MARNMKSELIEEEIQLIEEEIQEMWKDAHSH